MYTETQIKIINIKNFHFFFVFLILLKYIIPYFIFGSITLFYIDALDSEIVYNSIIGEILKGNNDKINLFANGEIKIEYLRRICQPYMFFYSWFKLENAYFLIDFLVKLTSYISFFILAKKINKNFFLCGLVSCIYALSNLPGHEGFGLAILPYVFYLGIYKNKINFKHLFLIVFFGVNSDLIYTGITLCTIGILFLIFDKKKFLHYSKILFIFFISIIIANWNLIEISFSKEIFHRVEFLRQGLSFEESIYFFLNYILFIPNNFKNSLLLNMPYVFFVLPIFLIFLFYKKKNDYDKKFRLPIYIILIFSLILILIKSSMVSNLINSSDNLFKVISWDYLKKSFVFLYLLSMILFLKKESANSKYLIFFSFISVFLFQINTSVVPFIKEKILQIPNYQNLYTFKGYYNYYDYTKIKKIVKDKRTLSVGIDPMVAVIHNIKVLDGYHNLYPLTYKKKFRSIIEPELKKNIKFKKYFDDWGSRLYTTLYHPISIDNIELNFEAAKNLGADFVISKYIIKSKKLKLLENNCQIEKELCLYEILD